ncbi:HET domain-containing protein [Colletotrichum higginsianum]|nr:HET domain-containing protein [Colletotrichum higginsianum]
MRPTSEAPGISYRALDHTTDAFRLLYIRPPECEPSSPHSDLVTTELQYHRLSNAPPFTALSYCWGAAVTQSPIVIDGAVQRCGLNGELALRHLRGAEGVHVWIDQLCINQDDNAEKGHQVQMMRHIYSAAARVAVWMGLPADDSDLFLPHVRAMGTLIRQQRYADVVRAHADMAFLRRVSHAFRAFCERQYWTRLWIIQEFAVGAEIDVLCGRASVGYADLRGFLVFLNKATDPRDRVFAVMHFADDVDEFEGLPDYSLGCEEVYRAAARRILMQGNIDLLSYCQFPREAPSLATWAPDWQTGIKRPNVGNPWLSKFDASASASASSLPRQQLVVAPDAETVQLRGVLVDAVAETGGDAWDPNWVEELDRGAALAFVDEVGRLCEKSPLFGDRVRARDLKDVMRICIADRYHYREPERQAELLEGFAQAELWMRRDVGEARSGAEMGLQMSDSLGWQQPWYVTAMKNLHGRRPFLSGSGYVGLAPRHVQPGDKVVVFLGGKTPYIVRDSTGAAGYCELVGEAYVHGIMFGEAMTDDCEVREFLLR